MVAICSENHVFARDVDKPIPIELLASEPIILLEEGSYSEPLSIFQKYNVSIDVQYRIHDDFAIMTMVETGLGVSILSKLSLERMNYKIVSRPLYPAIEREIVIAYLKDNSLPIATQKFI